jgi:hypothetical protein
MALKSLAMGQICLRYLTNVKGNIFTTYYINKVNADKIYLCKGYAIKVKKYCYDIGKSFCNY